MVATIAVSAAVYAIDKPYSYKVPDDMSLQVGMRVTVPFGRGNRRCEGLVLDILPDSGEGLKSIDGLLDETPLLTPADIRMAAFIRERYFCTFYDAVKAILPAGFWFRTNEEAVLTDTPTDPDSIRRASENGWLVLQQLLQHNGRMEIAALQAVIGDADAVQNGLQFLRKKKILQTTVDFTRKQRDKSEKIATLSASTEETMDYAVRKRRSAPLQYEVLKLLCAIGSGSTKEIGYLTGATMATIRRLEELGYLTLSDREVLRSPLPENVAPAPPLVLSQSQQEVFAALQARTTLEKPGTSLLYGVTGSGKTSVYLQLIRHVLAQKRSVIYLVPEIALTPQLLHLLVSHFGSEVAVLHSGLRVTERYDEWKRIRTGRARVVIGTRSAIFAPVENLGLVIVDEEQEHSYKSENSPRYHAREVAIYRGTRERALVLLGSATPSLETMYLARTGVYGLYRLPERYNGKQLPAVELIDLKEELKQGNNSAISRPLRKALTENIAAGHQSILFLNRRGAGRRMICVDCGEVIMCPRCSVSLTYHTANNRLMCHYCGYSQPLPNYCPHCDGHLKTVGFGTQRIEQELRQLFPETEILRMDADTVSATNTHEAILTRFQQEKIPILLGTQMVTKGLNFENVTLVGVLDADSSLYVDHYRASETTFSMLTQVVGRAGRGNVCGRALIQSMSPEHSVIRLAAGQDYDRFYDLEITLRGLQKAPPHSDVFSVMFLGLFEAQVIAAAGAFRRLLDKGLRNLAEAPIQASVLGPSPAAVSKVNNAFRYRVTLHCPNSRSVRQLLSHLLQVFAKDKISKGVTAFIDINAYE